MIAVCVPFWRRQDALDRMFENYARLYGDLEIEFSVCDDGSPEPATVPAGVVLTRLPPKGCPLNPCVPINHAVATSTGDVIVLTNPEIEHREPVLVDMLAMLEHEDDYVVASCRDTDGMLLAGDGVRYDQDGRLPVPPGAHFHFLAMLHRSLWKKAGGFDEDYRFGQACDDNDWTWRLDRAGARFELCPGVVWHTRSGLRWELPHNRELFLAKWPGCR